MESPGQFSGDRKYNASLLQHTPTIWPEKKTSPPTMWAPRVSWPPPGAGADVYIAPPKVSLIYALLHTLIPPFVETFLPNGVHCALTADIGWCSSHSPASISPSIPLQQLRIQPIAPCRFSCSCIRRVGFGRRMYLAAIELGQEIS